MKQEALSFYPDIHLLLIAMSLFLFSFTLLMWRVLQNKNKQNFNEMAQLPLTQETSNEQ